ncbi:Protein C48B6.3 [Aphelenchoides avenae]|nr:Protein C48B6.3 [Aphelenchus avenae]
MADGTRNDRARGSDDESDDGLWNDFESCAQAVAHLFRANTFQNLQAAAARTTQLYKSGVECKKRSREKGFHIGRESLAKEILSLRRFSNKIEVQDVLALLTRYSLVPYNEREASPRQRTNSVPRSTNNNNSASAVNLFQQVLCPPSPNPSSPHRLPELDHFLQRQVRRHRKRRAHSPNTGNADDPMSAAVLQKRFKHL